MPSMLSDFVSRIPLRPTRVLSNPRLTISRFFRTNLYKSSPEPCSDPNDSTICLTDGFGPLKYLFGTRTILLLGIQVLTLYGPLPTGLEYHAVLSIGPCLRIAFSSSA